MLKNHFSELLKELAEINNKIIESENPLRKQRYVKERKRLVSNLSKYVNK